MANISGWTAHRPMWALYISFMVMFAIVASFYLVGRSHRDVALYLFLASIIGIASGLTVASVASAKRLGRAYIGIGMCLSMAGGGFFFGALTIAYDHPLFFILLTTLLTLLFFLCVAVEIQLRSIETLTIEVGDGYSRDFILAYLERLEGLLVYKRIPYDKRGTEFIVRAQERNRIAIRFSLDQIGERFRYSIFLEAGRLRDSLLSRDLRREIQNIVDNLDRTQGIETFSKIDSATCKRCGRHASYIVWLDKFYCRHCNMTFKIKDVTVRYIGTAAS